jgi:hypothetical protein
VLRVDRVRLLQERDRLAYESAKLQQENRQLRRAESCGWPSGSFNERRMMALAPEHHVEVDAKLQEIEMQEYLLALALEIDNAAPLTTICTERVLAIQNLSYSSG